MKILLMETHKGFQSTLPARGATRGTVSCGCNRIISIHAPRTGSDARLVWSSSTSRNFNPRSPHGERLPRFRKRQVLRNFNPRSPHGERQYHRRNRPGQQISIHAPRTGSDKARAQAPSPVRTFQSTLPARGATLTLDVRVAGNEHFNPRSPHGERPYGDLEKYSDNPFQSTLPARGATSFSSKSNCSRQISIHAPRTGSDTCGLSDSPHR